MTDAMVAEFKEHVQKSRVKFDEAAWKKDLAFIRAMIRFEIDVDLFGVAVARKNLSRHDPQLQFALALFPGGAAAAQHEPAATAAGARSGEVSPSLRPARHLESH